jgi:hypothetical protein
MRHPINSMQLEADDGHDWRFAVDEIVYEPYNPTNYGKILDRQLRQSTAIGPTEFYFVRWKDGGSEDWVWYHDMKSLEALTAKHEKTAANHRKRLEKGRAL